MQNEPSKRILRHVAFNYLQKERFNLFVAGEKVDFGIRKLCCRVGKIAFSL